jgi:recombination protein RecA
MSLTLSNRTMIVMASDAIPHVNRLPTGIAPLDLLDGGIPENRVTEIFGAPGSCKSILASLIVASKQHICPEQKCLWIAVESFDPKWAEKFGVNTTELLVANPAHSEQVVDLCKGFMEAGDCGLVVLDNLAGMVTKFELENSAEIDDPGGPGRINKKLFNTVMKAQQKAAEDIPPSTFVFTNQMRTKIGTHGSELTSFGGPIPKNACALRLRLEAKDIYDKAVHIGLPARKKVHLVVEKAKIPVAALECTFEIAVLNQVGLKIGQVKDNWKIVSPAFAG